MQGLNGVQGILGVPQPRSAPAFTLAERDRRWARLWELMAEQGLDVLLVFCEWLTSDSLYISDTQGVTIFPRDDEPSLVLGGEASNFAVEQPSWIDDRVSVSARGHWGAYGPVVVDVMTRRGLLGGRIGIAGLKGGTLATVRQPDGYAGYSSVKAVVDAARRPIIDATDVLGQARYVKGEEEIARLAAAIRIGEASAEAMVETAASGVAQAEVFAQMLVAQVRAGADELQISWLPGEWGQHRHRYVSPPPGVLSDGTYVSVELMPEIRGYQPQVTQAMVVGEPTEQAKEIFELNATAFDRAMTLLRPGNTWGDVVDGVNELAEGTTYDIYLLCHGRGLGNDGPLLVPSASPAFARDFPIIESTTFILKPFALPKSAASPITRMYDVTWGDTIVIRSTGAERLGTRPRHLPVC